MKRVKKNNKVLQAIIKDNRVICPHCGAQENFAPAYDYKSVEYNGQKVIQFFVRCIHKITEEDCCNHCSTYLLNLNMGKRYQITTDENLKVIADESSEE